MRLLIDTHILIWAIAEPLHLDQSTIDVLSDPENSVCFSAA